MSPRRNTSSFTLRLVKILAALLALTLGTYAVSASAAPNEHYTAFGWHSTKFTVKPFTEDVPVVWNTALQSAVTTWNEAHPEVEISIDPDSTNTVYFVDEFFAHDGREAEYKKICLPTGCWFEIALDSEHLELKPKDVRLLGEFLLLHELGHALGLNDFERTSPADTSVMANYQEPHKKPKLHPYDRHLIAERISLMKRNPHQLIPTLALGVIRPAAEWVASQVVDKQATDSKISQSE